jgi:diacylglycerol kinase (ATP)
MVRFSFRARWLSFRNAFRGLIYLVKAEHNLCIQLVAALAAIALGIICRISRSDWLIIILCIGFVIAAEIMNSAVERLVDLVSPQENKTAGIIKDIAAGSVLIAAIAALVAGIVVFVPYFT